MNAQPNSLSFEGLYLETTQTAVAWQEPPSNPFLADSPWPTYHRNSYAQASTPFSSVEPDDLVEVNFIETDIGGVSPWSQISETYLDGNRVVWGATTTHIFKASLTDDSFELLDSYRIDFNPFSFHWNLFLLSGNDVIVPDPGQERLYRFSDLDPSRSDSPIVLEDEFDFPDDIPGTSAFVNLTYDGWVVFVTDEGYIGAVTPDFSEYRALALPLNEGEANFHNAFSLDEEGGIYLVTTERMMRVDWQDNEFELAWDAPYNFRGPGFENIVRSPAEEFLAVINGEPGTGSGTTPTLMGLDGEDELVLVADGHSPSNNMIAFWRDEIPDDWEGLPGYDRRVAAVVPLPYSTPDGDGFTAENSPTVWGYGVAIAQYNGFSPGENPVPGVQKLEWDPEANALELAWATDEINFNGVMTYSAGSNLLYGTGRRDSIYYFWGLDWDTGEVAVEIELGDSDDYLDQGNQISIDEDGTIVFGSATGIVQIRPVSPDAAQEADAAGVSLIRANNSPSADGLTGTDSISAIAGELDALATDSSLQASAALSHNLACGDVEVDYNATPEQELCSQGSRSLPADEATSSVLSPTSLSCGTWDTDSLLGNSSLLPA